MKNCCKIPEDWWVGINSLQSQDKERFGFPTQKPIALYERIVLASSQEGSIVLDPFCGCATTPIVAERLGRQWVGIDIWENAVNAVLDRLQKERLALPAREREGLFTDDIHFVSEPPERSDDGETAAPPLRVRESIKEPPGKKMTRTEMYEYLLDQHGSKCQGCYREFDDPRYLELDHNTPRADGGLNHVSNRILLCSPCNRLKSNTLTLSGLRRENKKQGYMR